MVANTDASRTKIGGHELRKLAVAVPCDPRTLKKALAGGAVSLVARAAIRRALEERGLLDLLPPVPR